MKGDIIMKHSKKVTAFVLSMLILCSTSLLSVSARSGDVLFEDGYGNQISKYNYVGIYVEEEKPVTRIGEKRTNEVFENCDISFIFEHPAYLTMGEDITDNTFYYNTYFQGATDVYVLMFDLDWKAIKVYDRVKDTTSIIPKNQLSMRQFEAGFVTYNYTKWKYTQPQNLTITVKGSITDERLVLRPRTFQFSYNVKLITKEEANKLLNKPTAKPAAPALSVSNKSNGIRVTWNSIRGAIRYIVYYKKSTDKGWSSAVTTNLYYPILNAQRGALYYVQVRPVGATVSQPYSSVKSIVFK